MPTIPKTGRVSGAALALVIGLAQYTGAFQGNQDARTGAPQARREIPPGAREVAELVGVFGLVERLDRLEAGDQTAAVRLETLALRQEIVEGVLGASLEIDGVIAEIDNEVAQINESRAYLEDRRDHALALNTIANIVSGGGVGIVGQLLQIRNQTSGSIVGAAAGGGSAVLSALGLRQGRGGKQALGVAPNMLARIFDRRPEFHSEYPETVWRYFDAVPPAEPGGQTRRAQLVRDWVRLGRIEPPESPKGGRKIDLLTSSVTSRSALTIDVLADRSIMLADVRSKISLMKRDLGRLMMYLRGSRKVSVVP
jgi:hypothetical protein